MSPLPDDGDFDEVACEECRSSSLESECNRGYPIFCLKPIRLLCVPNDSWFCSYCICQKKLKPFPIVQTKLVDFFQIRKCSNPPPIKSHSDRSKKRRHGGLAMSKKKRRLLPFNPSDDEKKRLEQTALSQVVKVHGRTIHQFHISSCILDIYKWEDFSKVICLLRFNKYVMHHVAWILFLLNGT